jgi:hypothetical protein
MLSYISYHSAVSISMFNTMFGLEFYKSTYINVYYKFRFREYICISYPLLMLGSDIHLDIVMYVVNFCVFNIVKE